MNRIYFNNAELARKEGIAPMKVGGMIIGYVDEIHGQGGMEIVGFAPIRHELLQLVKFWAKTVVNCRWRWFVTGGQGSDDIRVHRYGMQRIEEIEQHIGQATVDRAVAEEWDEYSNGINAEHWDAFCSDDYAWLDDFLNSKTKAEDDPQTDGESTSRQ